MTDSTVIRRPLGAIVFTDVVDYTSRMQVDEDGTLQLVNRDLGDIERLCNSHGGEVINRLGDGLLLHFGNAADAVKCAIQVQEWMVEAERKGADGQFLRHRIGIHLGDIVIQDGDVRGNAVNVAARVREVAEPGGICFTRTVWDVVKNRVKIKPTNLGPKQLKHIADAVEIYEYLIDALRERPGRVPLSDDAAPPQRAPTPPRPPQPPWWARLLLSFNLVMRAVWRGIRPVAHVLVAAARTVRPALMNRWLSVIARDARGRFARASRPVRLLFLATATAVLTAVACLLVYQALIMTFEAQIQSRVGTSSTNSTNRK
jgi:class 3 adenylate cyclase